MKKRSLSCAALLASLVLLATASCSEIGYYAQCVEGHLGLLVRRQSVEALLADPAAAPELKSRLATALRIRDFASRELRLPENGSYRCYVDLQRPEVVWNVVAAPEFSLSPKQWCFPVAGCVSYRGYYEQREAEQLAERLRAEGYDVNVYGVSAYSTLGWFDDPLLNTFLERSDTGIAEVVFHELAHQLLYLPDDSAFSEAFATAVEEEGVARWLRMEEDAPALTRWQQAQRREEEFAALLLEARRRLEACYGSDAADADRRAQKKRIFADLESAYARLKVRWGGYAGYDRWFAVPPNNARLAAVGTYRDLVPAFREMLRQAEGDLPLFYHRAAEVARLPAKDRAARLAAGGGDRGETAARDIARLWDPPAPLPRGSFREQQPLPAGLRF